MARQPFQGSVEEFCFKFGGGLPGIGCASLQHMFPERQGNGRADNRGSAGRHAKFRRSLNPLHVDEAYALSTRFGGRLAHGMLSVSLVCAVLGLKLPGPGRIHLEQTLRFLAPVRFGDTLTARVKVL